MGRKYKDPTKSQLAVLSTIASLKGPKNYRIIGENLPDGKMRHAASIYSSCIYLEDLGLLKMKGLEVTPKGIACLAAFK
jgi:hypothetical protein